MGGRGIKRPKVKPKDPQGQVPKIPKKKQDAPIPKMPKDPPVKPKKRKGGSSDGEGGGGGGSTSPQVPPIPKKKEDEGKTVKIGGFYYKLQNGKLTRLGSKSEEYDMTDTGVTVKIGSKEYHVDSKGRVKEVEPKKEKTEAEKLSRFLENYTPKAESVKPKDRIPTIQRKLKEQHEENLEIFKKAGIEYPSNEQMIKTFTSIGLDEYEAEGFVNDKHEYWSVYTDSRRSKSELAKFYVENEDLHKSTRLNAYVLAKTIDDVQKNILNKELFEKDSLIKGFKIYNTSPSVGGGMDGRNVYYVPLNRLSVSQFKNPEKGFGEHNIDFTLPGVAVHELGHAVHNKIKKLNPEIENDIEKLFRMSHLYQLRPSLYAMEKKEEFFAETFLGYIKYKQWKQDSILNNKKNPITNKPVYDPNNPIYEAMEEILSKSGILKGSTTKTGRLSQSTFDKIEKYAFENVDWDMKVYRTTDEYSQTTFAPATLDMAKTMKEMFKEQYEKYGKKK